MLKYLTILFGSFLLSCTGHESSRKATSKKMTLSMAGTFLLPGDAELGITQNSLSSLERYPGFFFKKSYKIVRDSLVTDQFFKDSLKTELTRSNFAVYYDSLYVLVDKYLDFNHSGFVPNKTFYICGLKSDGVMYTLYRSEKEWAIYLKAEKGNESDSIWVSKMDDGCTLADFVLRDITGDGQPEIIVFNHCMIGPNAVKNVGVYLLKQE